MVRKRRTATSLCRWLPVAAFLALVFAGCSYWSAGWDPTDAGSRDAFPNAVGASDFDEFVGTLRPVDGGSDAAYRLALHFQDLGRHDWALDEFQRLLGAHPGHAKAYNGVGISLDLLGDHRRAAAAYGMAVSLAPENADFWNNKGYSAYLAGDLDEAERCIRKAIELDGERDRYHNNLGLVFARRGERESAYQALRKGGDDQTAAANLARLFPGAGEAPPDRAAVTADRRSGGSEGGDAEEPTRRPPAPIMTADIPETEPPVSTPAQTHGSVRSPDAPATIDAPAPAATNHTTAAGFSPEFQAPGAGASKIEVVLRKTRDGITLGLNEFGRHLLRSRRSGEGSSTVSGRIAGNPRFESTFRPDAGAAEPAASPAPTPGSVVASAEPDFADIPAAPFRAAAFRVENIAEPPSAAAAAAVQVSNGNGVRFMATRVGRFLREKGYSVDRINNADHFAHDRTVIYYREGFFHDARQVARDIPGDPNLLPGQGITDPHIQVRLLLGRDVVSFDALLRRSGGDGGPS